MKSCANLWKITLLLLFLKIPTALLACDCQPTQTPIEGYREAATVFSGKVVQINRYQDYNEVVFDIHEIWKGIIDYQIIIQTKNTSCDWSFIPNMEYLVYAFQYDDGTYGTDKCTRTNFLHHAKEDKGKFVTGFQVNDYIDDCYWQNYISRITFCSGPYTPVCGCDGKTYGSPCDAKRYGIKILYRGKCR